MSASCIGLDTATQMLQALAAEDPVATSSPTQRHSISLEEQKKYLKKHIDSLSIDDRRNVARVLFEHDKGNLLIACAEGSIINLEVLPTHVIKPMYDVMAHCLENRK